MAVSESCLVCFIDGFLLLIVSIDDDYFAYRE